MSFTLRPRSSKIDFEDAVSLTDQHYKDEVDIHNIIKKYAATGVLTHVNQYEGSYGDFASLPDYHEAKTMIAECEEMFATVPAHIRADMQNSPAVFVDFMQNSDNIERIEAYGLDAAHLKPLETQNVQINTQAAPQSTAAQNPPPELQNVSGENAPNTASNEGTS